MRQNTLVENFAIGDKSQNSDHMPIHVWIQIQPKEIGRKLQDKSWSYKMQINKRKTYATSFDNKLARECIPSEITQAWQQFKKAMSKAVEETIGKMHKRRINTKGPPCNSWFDEECKHFKRKLRTTTKTTIEWITLVKEYNALKRKKRREHELYMEIQALTNLKKNPKTTKVNSKPQIELIYTAIGV